jgi:hypothetical protein
MLAPDAPNGSAQERAKNRLELAKPVVVMS